MPFDPNTASPVSERTGFDPSSDLVELETPSLRAAVPAPGEQIPTVGASPQPETTQAFPAVEQAKQETAKIPALTGSEAEAILLEPQFRIPRMAKEGSALRGVENLAYGIPEFASSPAAPLIATAQLVPGVREAVNAVLAGSMVKAGAQELGEASVTGNKEQLVTGAGSMLLGAAGLAGTLKSIPEKPVVSPETVAKVAETAPVTAEALKEVVKPVENEVPNASEVSKAAEVHGNVSSVSEVGAPEKGMPAEERSAGVRNEAEAVAPPATEPEIIGMGGAVPSEFEPVGKTVTGIRNAVVDQERVARGLPPAMRVIRRDFGEVWDRAMARIDQDPASIDTLLTELRDKPRALTDTEDAMLLHRQVDLQNEYAKATRDLAQAFDDGRDADVVSQKIRVEGLRDQLYDLYEVGKKSGTETGRGLNARRMMANEDFSLASLENEMRAAKGGRRLTETELAEAKATAEKFQKSNEELSQHLALSESKRVEAETARAIAELKAQHAVEYEPRVLKMAEQFATFMDKKAESAMARLRERLKQTNTLDPTVVADLSIVGAAKITRGVVDFAKWSDAMVRDFGDAVKPYLEEAFKAAQTAFEKDLERYSKPLGKATGDKLKKTVKDMTVGERQSDLVGKIKKRIADGEGTRITPLVQKLARNFIRAGITEREPLIDAVHGVLKDIMPEWTRRETMDAISGYGDFKGLTKDDISVRLRDLKGQMQQIGKLEDMANKQAPSKTGVQRRIPSQAERELIKAVNEAKRKGGYVTTDPESQLRTALDEVKSRIQTQIADYQKRLEAEDYSVRKPTPIQLDEEALRLKANLERVRREWRHARDLDAKANRHWLQKFGEAFVRWERNFKLSSPVVFGKLTAAAMTRIGTTAVEESVGSALSKAPILSEISKRAPREGRGLNAEAAGKAIASALTRGMRDAAQTAKKGMSDLDAVFGEKAGLDFDWANIFGQLHGMLKAPVKRAEFEYSLAKRMEHAIANGVDVTDPLVQTRLATEAINDGYRAIFMQRGFSADMFNSLVNMMEKSKKYPVSGEISARMLRFLLPVVRVPINIVGETMTGITGVPMASARTMFHVIKGTLKDLDPVVADSIMRQFKKGSIGLGLVAVGYFNKESIGGYDWREKRKQNEVKTGGFQINGTDIPRWVTHAPWFELMQFGATIRRVKDQHVKGKDKGISEGMWAAGLGLLEETPFYGQMLRVSRASESESKRTAFMGEMAKGAVVPQAVAAVAKWTDPEEKRKPTTILEHIETGIPGLRQNVPVARPKR